MVYSYLLELYKVLDERKRNIEVLISKLPDDSKERQFQQGRLTALTDFEDFLTTHYQSKLPRRMQSRR